jgi:hypothetical protein
VASCAHQRNHPLHKQTQNNPRQPKTMKTTLILASALFGASLSLSIAQGPGGPGGQGGERPAPPSPAEAAAELSKRYAALAAFDADKSGKLEAAELDKVAAAIEDGSLEMGPPGGRPPGGPEGGKGGKPPGGSEGGKGGKPNGKRAATGAAKLFESLAPYDKDKSGTIDETEQAAVATAIEDGSLKLPRGGGRGQGGPGGRPPGGPEGGPEGGRGGRGPGRPPGGQ